MRTRLANFGICFWGIWTILALTLAKPAIAELSSTPNPNTWVTNGPVYAIETDGDTVYLGGDFDYIGPNTGHGAEIDLDAGELTRIGPFIDLNVLTCVADGSGGWFIGGRFSRVGSVERNHLAHLLADGSVDPNWVVDVSGPVYALAISGSRLYIGGEYRQINGYGRRHIAAVDVVSGEVLDWPVAGAIGKIDDTYINAIATNESHVFIGGKFNQIGSHVRSCLAELDATTGDVTDWAPHIVKSNSVTYTEVNTIAVSNSIVYYGGWFTDVDEMPRGNMAATDLNTHELIDWNPDVSSIVRSIIVSDSTIYAGGVFRLAGGQTREGVAAWDEITLALTDWTPEVNSAVHTLAKEGSTIYIGGDFTKVNNIARNRIAAIDAVTGNVSNWSANANSNVRAMAIFENKMYVGGYFTSVNGMRCYNLAALDTHTGKAIPWNPSDFNSGYVNCLAIKGDTLFAGGLQQGKSLVAVNKVTGQNLNLNTVTNGEILTMDISGSTIYIGGNFSKVNNVGRSKLAAVDIDSGALTNWNPNANGNVLTLKVSNFQVYVGGEFTQVGNEKRWGGAAVDMFTGHLSDWNPNAIYGTLGYPFVRDQNNEQTDSEILLQDRNVQAEWDDIGYIPPIPIDKPGAINSILITDSTAYAGGRFSKIGGELRYGIASLDLVTAAAQPWTPEILYGSNIPIITSMAFSRDGMLVGGYFTRINGESRLNLAEIDLVTGNATNWNPQLDDAPSAIVSTGSRVFVGGRFEQVGGQGHPYFAQFDIIDTVPPTSSASSADLVQVGAPIVGTYVADDGVDGSGVAKVELYALEPGDVWRNSGEVTGGTFSYWPMRSGEAANGRYHFATVATDGVGNRETAPTDLYLGDVAILGDVMIDFIDAQEATGTGFSGVGDWDVLN